MKRFYLLSLSILLFSCSSEVVKIHGHVQNNLFQNQAGVVLRLIVVNNLGQEQTQLSTTISDENGQYLFTFSLPTQPDGTYWVQAILPDKTLYALAMQQTISPITHQIVQAMVQISSSNNGASLSDVSASDVKIIDEDLTSVQTAVFKDLSDQEQLDEIWSEAGRSIVESFQSSVQADALSSFEPQDLQSPAPLLGVVGDCSRPAMALSTSLYEYDFTESGTICNIDGIGTIKTNAFDIGFVLSLNDQTFVDSGNANFPGDNETGDPAIVLEDDREIVYGPALTSQGLSVTRKVYVPQNSDYIRFIEIIENTSSIEKFADVSISGELGLGDSINPPIVLADSSRDSIANEDDGFAVFIPSSIQVQPNPTLALVWNDSFSNKQADVVLMPPENDNAFVVSFFDVSIPAQSIKTIVTFAKLLSTQSEDVAHEELDGFYNNLDFSFMNSSELKSMHNMQSNVGNIVASAGYVVPNSLVTVTNSTQNASIEIRANNDGSFHAPLLASTGDAITISSSDGLSQNLNAQ